MDTVKPVPAWKKCNAFFYGVGGHGQGHAADASMFSAEWIKSHNFANVSFRTITALNDTPNVSSGIQIDNLLHLYASLEGAKAVSLERQGVVGYLVITASDAMAIKPELQFSPHSNGIIGLTSPSVMTVEMIKELSTKNEKEIVSHLKNCKFNTQALEVYVTLIDDRPEYLNLSPFFTVAPKVVGKP